MSERWVVRPPELSTVFSSTASWSPEGLWTVHVQRYVRGEIMYAMYDWLEGVESRIHKWNAMGRAIEAVTFDDEADALMFYMRFK